jgi:hypothetical protein
MATKTELIGGLELLITESKRVGARFSEDEWARAAEEAGWTNREVLAHIAATGGIAVQLIGGMASAPAGTDLGANLDVDALNAQFVTARAGKSIPELVSEVDASYRGVIDFLRGAPDDLLEKRATIGGYADMTVSDIAMQMLALHGLAHIYHAASRFP